MYATTKHLLHASFLEVQVPRYLHLYIYIYIYIYLYSTLGAQKGTWTFPIIKAMVLGGLY